MVELALHENVEKIAVEKVVQPSGQHAIRVHLGFDSTSAELEEALVEHGLEHLSPEVISLFSDDAVKRRYETHHDFVLVLRG